MTSDKSHEELPQSSSKDHKLYSMLENNPAVMNRLSNDLSLMPSLIFHDVYSLHDRDLLSAIPGPVHALLATIPISETWKSIRAAEDSVQPSYPDCTVPFFLRQQSPGACGLIALIHCLANLPHALQSHSILSDFIGKVAPLSPTERGEALSQSEALFGLNEQAACTGDTPRTLVHRSGNHFLALVKVDGHLWELEGSRRGPLYRGALRDDEDMLSERALEIGMRRLVGEVGGDAVRVSCLALNG